MEIAERIAKLSPEQRKLLEIKLKKQGINIDISRLPQFETSNGIQGNGRKDSIYRSLEVAEKKEYYVLSSAQKRFFMLQQLDVEGMVFNMFHMMIVTGKLIKQKFEEAYGKLLNNQETLRTSIEIMDGEPRQKITPHVEYEIGYFETADEKEIEKIIKNFSQPFNLMKPPFMRLGLIKLTGEKHFLLFDMHHIISDATSVNILVKYLINFYAGKELPPLNIQYKDYCEWQNHLLMSGEMKAQEAYWLKHLSGDLPVLNMPTDYPRPSFQNFAGAGIDFQWDEEFTQALSQLARQTGTTLFMILLAIYNILLSKYARQYDIIIGTPIAGRNNVDLENVIGLFIETLALRNRPESNKTFKEFLEEVKENTLNAFENQVYPFRELLKKLGNENDFSRNPLFDAMLIMQKRDIRLEKFQVGEINVVPYERPVTIEAKVDLNLDVKDKEGKLFFTLEYCTGLFKKETMERFIDFFKEIASIVIQNKGIKLSDITVSHDLSKATSHLYEGKNSEFEF